jgi:ankyrin repeat protein
MSAAAQQFVAAAAAGKLTDVKIAIEHVRLHPDCTNDFGDTPLLVASEAGYVEVVRYLVAVGATLDLHNKYGQSSFAFPLQKASERGHLPVVAFLLESGAEKNKRTSDGRTALHWAVTRGQLKVVEYLAKQGCDVNIANEKGTTPLGTACEKGNYAMVRLLCECGAPVDLNKGDDDGWTPLYASVFYNYLEVATYLCKHPACRVNQPTKMGTTPLRIAAQQGKLTEATVLINHGADVSSRDDNGRTCVDLLTATQRLQVRVPGPERARPFGCPQHGRNDAFFPVRTHTPCTPTPGAVGGGAQTRRAGGVR